MSSHPSPTPREEIEESHIDIGALSPTTVTSSPSEVGSLPDSAPSDDIEDSEDASDYDYSRRGGISDAERQWRESIQQLELLLTMVLVPYAGKYLGRKFAYYVWARVMEWKHPNIEVVFSSKKTFRAAGAVEAAASL